MWCFTRNRLTRWATDSLLLLMVFLLVLSQGTVTSADITQNTITPPWRLTTIGPQTGTLNINGDEQAFILTTDDICLTPAAVSDSFTAADNTLLQTFGYDTFGDTTAVAITANRASVQSTEVPLYLAPTVLRGGDLTLSTKLSADTGGGAGGNSLALYLTAQDALTSQNDGYGVRYQGDGVTGSWQLVRYQGTTSVLADVPASGNHPTTERFVELIRTGNTLNVKVDSVDIGLSYTESGGLPELIRYGLLGNGLTISNGVYLDDLTLNYTTTATCPELASTGVWDDRYPLYFAHQTILTDGEISARINSHTNTGSGISGLVMRQGSLQDNLSVAFVFNNSNNTLDVIVRDTQGGTNVTRSLGISGSPPQWLKLDHHSGTVTAHTSTDGSNWTQVDSVAITFTGAIEAGIALAVTGTAQQIVDVDNASVISELSGTISIDTTLRAGQNYKVVDNLNIDAAANLTIEEGAILAFDANKALNVYGGLDIAGTAGNEVVLTSGNASPAANDWQGVYIYAGTGAVTIDHAVIEYAQYGLNFDRSGDRGTVTNTTLRYNTYGVQLSGDNSQASNNPTPSIVNGSIHDNTSYNLIAQSYKDASSVVLDLRNNWWGTTSVSAINSKIYDAHNSGVSPYVDYGQFLDGVGGSPVYASESLMGLVSDTLAPLTANTSYHVLGRLTVADGESWTIPEGVTIEFVGNTTRLNVYGGLDIAGTAGNEVVLTSGNASPAANDWQGVYIYAGTGAVTIDHAVIEYAQYGLNFDRSGDRGTVTNTTLRYNTYGVQLSGDNSQASNNPTPSIVNGSIHDNTSYNLIAQSYKDASSVVLDLRNNWWGTTSVSAINSKIYDAHNSGVSPYVDYGQFLDGVGGSPVYASESLMGLVSDTLAPLTANTSYHVLGRLTVADGESWTIPEGVTIEFVGNTTRLNVYGGLDIAGTAGNEVVLTSGNASPAANDWQGVYIYAGTGAVTIDHAVIEYAQYGLNFDRSGDRGTVTNTTLRYNTYGVQLSGDNSQASNNPTPSIVNGSIHDNTSYNLIAQSYKDASSVVLDLRNNWWGTTSVSAINSKIYDAHNSGVSPYVDYGQFLDGVGGSPVYASESLMGLVSDTLAPLTANTSYHVLGRLTVADGESWTIPEGVTIEFVGNTTRLNVYGGLDIAGTAGNEVVLTSGNASPAANDWQGVYIYAGTGAVTIDHAVIEYAQYGLNFDRSGDRGTVTNTTLRYNTYGVQLSGDNSQASNNPTPSIVNGSIHDNTSYNLIAQSYKDASSVVLDLRNNWWGTTSVSAINSKIYDAHNSGVSPYVDYGQFLDGVGGSPVYASESLMGLVSDTLAPLTANTSYHVLGRLTVADGESWTIPEGVTIEFVGNTTRLNVYGGLDIAGTAGNEVVLTSGNASPAANDWQGVYIYAGTGAVTIDHAVIEYAQYGLNFDRSGDRGTVTNTTLRYNTYGVQLSGDNSQASNNPTPSIVNGSIHDNTSYNLIAQSYKDASSVVLDLRNNWWGTTSVSAINSKIYDAHNSGVSPYVDYGQFLDGVGGSPVYASESLMGLVSDTLAPLTANTSYHVLGRLTVADGESWTIPEGVTIEFVGNTTRLNVYGGLDIAGTAGNEVVLTSGNASPAANDWQGVYIYAGTGAVTIDHAVIEYAQYGLNFDRSGDRGTVTNTTLRYNTYGVQLSGDNSQASNNPTPSIVNGSIHDNTSYNLIAQSYKDASSVVLDLRNNWWGTTSVSAINSKIYDAHNSGVSPYVDYGQFLDGVGGSPVYASESLMGLVSDTLAPLTANTSYHVLGRLTVADGESWTIPEGVTIEFVGNTTRLNVYGGLDIAGTAGNEVVLTSGNASPAANDWQGVYIYAGTGAVTIDHAVIEYAQYGLNFDQSNSRGTVNNSLIRFNNIGIHLNAASPVFNGNRVIVNDYGFYLQGTGNDSTNPHPLINTNDIFSNTYTQLYAVSYGASSLSVDATDNWWGTASPALGVEIQGNSNGQIDFSSASIGPNQAPAIISASLSYAYFSPGINDGNQDTVNYTGTLSEIADWSLDILDSAGVVQQSFSGTTTDAVNVTWDGTDTLSNLVAEGRYRIRLNATAGSRSGVAGLRPVTVDNTAPIADIDDSQNGLLIQNLLQHTFVGIAADEHFSAYDLEYGAGASPVSYTPIVSSQTISKIDEELATWVVSSEDDTVVVPNGDYTLLLTVQDKAGNISTDTVFVTVDNITLTSISTNTGSLDLSLSETLNIDFDLNLPGTVTLYIYEETAGSGSTPVRTIQMVYGSGGSYSLQWDGLDDAGNDVPDEAYIYVLVAEDGTRIGAYNPVQPDGNGTLTLSNVGTSFEPYQNDYWSTDATLTAPGRARLGLILYNAGNRWLYPDGDGLPLTTGTHTLYWSGWDDVAGNFYNGTFGILVTYTEFTANTVMVAGGDGQTRITGSGTSVEVTADPYLIYLSYGHYTKINYHLTTEGSQPADMVIKLLPPGTSDFNDPAAIEILNEQQSPGDHEVTWTGIDTADPDELTRTISEDGGYTFAIQATVNGSSVLHRGVINVYQ